MSSTMVFDGEEQTSHKMRRKSHTKKWIIAAFLVGLTALIVAIVFLVIRLTSQPKLEDAEFLISTGEWVREDAPNVIWDFTGVGDGMLTTDGHLNNYPFIWSMEEGKIKIETTWLYDLSDEFTYTLDQNNKILIIKKLDDDTEIKFKAQDRPAKNSDVMVVGGDEEIVIVNEGAEETPSEE